MLNYRVDMNNEPFLTIFKYFLVIGLLAIILIVIAIFGLVLTQNKENEDDIFAILNYLKENNVDVSNIESKPIVVDIKVVSALEKYVKSVHGDFLNYVENLG